MSLPLRVNSDGEITLHPHVVCLGVLDGLSELRMELILDPIRFVEFFGVLALKGSNHSLRTKNK